MLQHQLAFPSHPQFAQASKHLCLFCFDFFFSLPTSFIGFTPIHITMNLQ